MLSRTCAFACSSLAGLRGGKESPHGSDVVEPKQQPASRQPMRPKASPIGIAFSVFVVGLAAFNLLLDFDFIEKGSHSSAPKYMEWYAAFGLIVTLIWLYIEMLRLLSKLRDRR